MDVEEPKAVFGGYGLNEDMWLPEKGLEHAKEAIQQFHDTHPEFVWMTAKKGKTHISSSKVSGES